jgi:hypothetical protein
MSTKEMAPPLAPLDTNVSHPDRIDESTSSNDHERQQDDQPISRQGSRASRPGKSASFVKRMTTGLFTPEKKIKKSPGFKESFVNLAKSSWVNVLLVFIPVS